MNFLFAEEGPGLLFGFLFFLGSILYLLLPFIVWRIWLSSQQTSKQLQELNARLERLICVIAPEAAQPLPTPEPEPAPETKSTGTTPQPETTTDADVAAVVAAAFSAETPPIEDVATATEPTFAEEEETAFSFGDEPPSDEAANDLASPSYREMAAAQDESGFETDDGLPPMEFEMPDDGMDASEEMPWEEEPAEQEEPFPSESATEESPAEKPFTAESPAEEPPTEESFAADSFSEEPFEEESFLADPPATEPPSDIDVAPVSEQEDFELEGNFSADANPDFDEDEDFSFETEANDYSQDLDRFADVDFSESSEEFELEPSPGAVNEFSWEQPDEAEDEMADEDFTLKPEPPAAADDDLASAFDENLNPNIDADDNDFDIPDIGQEPEDNAGTELELELPPDFSMKSDFDLDAELKSSTPDFSVDNTFPEEASEPPAPEPPAPEPPPLVFTPPPAAEAKPATLFARCEGCGHKLAYKSTLSGKRVRCPACQVAFVLP